MRVAPITSRFLDACRRRPTDFRPVWFMRQAGRYLRQYREIRARHGILEICKRPDLAATVTLQPVEILDVDAAIVVRLIVATPILSRIVPPLWPASSPVARDPPPAATRSIRCKRGRLRSNFLATAPRLA